MQNYADALESYLIPAEGGLMDKLKSAGKIIGKTLMAILQAIKKAIVLMATKVRELLSRKNDKKESPKDAVNRLQSENDELKARIRQLEEDEQWQRDRANANEKKVHDTQVKMIKEVIKVEDKKERASKMIADLKKQIESNEDKMEAYKKAEKNRDLYNRFQNAALTFIGHVSTQINKAYTALPKLVAEAKKYENKSRKDLHDDEYESDEDYVYDRGFYSKLQAALPTMSSGSWSYYYKTLKYSYLKRVQEEPGYLNFGGDMGRGFEVLIKQCTETIQYLEKMVKDINSGSENNPAYKMIISEITRDEGFIHMLRSSINISNEILNCYKTHDKMIIHTVYDAI